MKTFCLFLWKINRKKYCVLDKRGEISEQVHPHELSILGSEGDSTIMSPEPCPALKSFLQDPWADQPGIRRGLNHYEPRALPSSQAIPAASSASGCPAYTSTPLRRGKRLLEAACSISGKEAISCLLPNGSWRADEKSYFWGPLTMGKSVPGGVRIFCSPLYPQALEWHRAHSWALSVC